MPPRSIFTSGIRAKACAVARICASLSTLHGPAMIIGNFIIAKVQHFQTAIAFFFVSLHIIYK
jgi:hypothetical protein